MKYKSLDYMDVSRMYIVDEDSPEIIIITSVNRREFRGEYIIVSLGLSDQPNKHWYSHVHEYAICCFPEWHKKHCIKCMG